jgi:hypothetical protein
MVTGVLAPKVVATVKVAEVCPAGTVMLAGTVAAPLLLLTSVTCVPPAGAAAFNVTVPCDAPPASNVLGASVNATAAICVPR